MNILVLDNYDSFTYNLVHIIRELDYPVAVYRNDKIELEAVAQFDKILLSPGPGVPDDAGIMKRLIGQYGPSKSILGICLGHQGIGEVYGARLYNMPQVLHGITTETEVTDNSEYMFAGVSPKFQSTHYHSWAIEPASVPSNLKVTALNGDGLVMGIRHEQYDVRGLQFHPESIMTPEGPRMIKNWLLH